MSKKVVIEIIMTEFSVFLTTHDLQHQNSKTIYIRLYRESSVYCILRRNITTANKLKH
ncbi:hypothetical protein Hanom_Chr08g00703061 [Helianthus anomalus]